MLGLSEEICENGGDLEETPIGQHEQPKCVTI